LEDETSFVNLGLSEVNREALSLTMGPTFPSAFASYPDAYKFIGLTINVDDTKNLIQRETYSLLEFLGDIGGLYEFLYLFTYSLVKLFTSMKFISIFANKMFEWNEPDSFDKFGCYTQRIIDKETKTTAIKIPKCLEILTVCCCPPKWFR
jgi:hypothetical protein